MKYHDDGIGSLIMGAMFASVLVALAVFGVGIVLLVLSGGLVISVLKVRPKSLPVWVSLSVLALALLFALLSGGQMVSLILCLVSLAGVLVTCLIEKASHPQLFAGTNQLPIATDLIRNQWWTEPNEDDNDDEQEEEEHIVV